MIPQQQYFLAIQHNRVVKSLKGETTDLRSLSAMDIMILVRRYRKAYAVNRYGCWWAKCKADTLEQYAVLRERAWA